MERSIKGKEGGHGMAIDKITINLDGSETEFERIENGVYYAEIDAPAEYGIYNLEIQAKDGAGNTTILNASQNALLAISVFGWVEPKTNWKSTDRFNFVDYNRIKNNLLYVHNRASILSRKFEIQNMGNDITSYAIYWDAEQFNLFEQNLEIINKNFLKRDYGEFQKFYPNGVFIKWDELNRIESAILSMKTYLDVVSKTVNHLMFRLGTFKGVKT